MVGSEDANKEEKLPASTSQRASVKQEPTEVQDLMPNSQLLKLMMDRVEAAALSMQLGTPVSLPPVPLKLASKVLLCHQTIAQAF